MNVTYDLVVKRVGVYIVTLPPPLPACEVLSRLDDTTSVGADGTEEFHFSKDNILRPWPFQPDLMMPSFLTLHTALAAV